MDCTYIFTNAHEILWTMVVTICRFPPSLTVKSQSTASAQLSAYAPWLQTNRQIHRLTNRWTDGHYQVHYLPATRCFMVDKNSWDWWFNSKESKHVIFWQLPKNVFHLLLEDRFYLRNLVSKGKKKIISSFCYTYFYAALQLTEWPEHKMSISSGDCFISKHERTMEYLIICFQI